MSGGLSNHSFDGLLQYLTPDKLSKAPRRAKTNVGWPDGRRKFGTVAAAVLAVLSMADEEMSTSAVRIEVESALGGHVSRHSVRDVLLRRSNGAHPLVNQTRVGHYRILR
jgi:hypothetical protein